MKGYDRKMEYIVDAEEMRRADENTIQYFGMPQLVLMERAALAARDAILRKWPEIFSGSVRILVAAGNGNNGGDGAALARLFFLAGHDVTVLVSGQEAKYSSAMKKQMEILKKYGDDHTGRKDEFADGGNRYKDHGLSVPADSGQKVKAGRNLRILTDEEWKAKTGRNLRILTDEEREAEAGQNLQTLTDERRMSETGRSAGDYDLAVDALFGIGLSREVSGIYREKIAWLNQLSGKKAALDIPSGISAQDGSVLGCAFRADLTITFGFWKRGMLLYPGREFCGERKVADIGITAESFQGEYPAGITLDKKSEVTGELLLSRSPDSHKGSFGKVLLFAGSAGTPGAALLAGEAVLRSGAGMLQIVSPAENREIMITRLPEAMYQVLAEDTDWEKLLGWCDAVVIGPGIGQGRLAEQSMGKILTHMSEMERQKPIVLDADGLNLAASSGRLSGLIKAYTAMGGIVIMTPHMAELARLLHCGMQELQSARLKNMERFVRESGAVLVGKDAATVVGYADKGVFRYYINQTGNSGMATAGSGDVLSGIMGAMAALTAVKLHRKAGKEKEAAVREAYFRTAYRAVYLHGLAGDKAAEKSGEISMKAGDLIGALPELLRECKDQRRTAGVQRYFFGDAGNGN